MEGPICCRVSGIAAGSRNCQAFISAYFDEENPASARSGNCGGSMRWYGNVSGGERLLNCRDDCPAGSCTKSTFEICQQFEALCHGRCGVWNTFATVPEILLSTKKF